MTTGALANKRIMVVEDELMVSMLIEDALLDEGAQVIGPISNVPDALAAARDQAIDIALLDVNVRGVKIYPVAEVLAERSIPFLLLSGYGEDAVPRDRPNWRACSKPFEIGELIRVMLQELRQPGDTPGK